MEILETSGIGIVEMVLKKFIIQQGELEIATEKGKWVCAHFSFKDNLLLDFSNEKLWRCYN